MKIVIASDSFKGTFNSVEITRLIGDSFKAAIPNLNLVSVPLTDGGDGSINVIKHNDLSASDVDVLIHNPLFKIVKSQYLKIDNETCYIEVAKACGLSLIEFKGGNGEITTSFGIGDMIIDALNKGFKHVIIGLGGSATNDAGIGMLISLGAKIYDKNDELIKIGNADDLINIKKINLNGLDKRLFDTKFTILSDVKNYLLGDYGATYIFGPQKGINPEKIALIENGMENYRNIFLKTFNFDLNTVVGGGAAGGIGATLSFITKTKIDSGINFFIQFSNLKEKLKDADYLILGEGMLDKSSFYGKTIGGICKSIEDNTKIHILVICGQINIDLGILSNFNISKVYPLFKEKMTLDEYRRFTPTCIEKVVKTISKEILK
jgi:glycerate 2-kinase